MFGLGSKTIVGLDVGSSSIKAVELRKGRNGIEVAHLGLEAAGTRYRRGLHDRGFRYRFYRDLEAVYR